jgi:hypothetical protein
MRHVKTRAPALPLTLSMTDAAQALPIRMTTSGAGNRDGH